ncbi:MAG: hypothetical protein HZA61_08210 [Candidatus Eisenbacteria bacterium]|uniref:Polysaccharide biosynthesis protein C-terminal domain-containing protein n=1 Tax=Eiseniibacteriota bacterium TaxID=2212470 RepID=A0A933SD19_UNCEI|nr:hypothetical protein [Candidatus Eisenbacteria bacterium]
MRPAADGAAILGFKTGAAASQFLLLVMTARLFGVTFRGEIALFGATINLLVLVVGFAGGASIVYLAANDPSRRHLRHLLAASYAFCVAIPVLVAIGARALGRSLGAETPLVVFVSVLQAMLLVNTYVLTAGRAVWQASLLEFLRPFAIVALGAAVALTRGYRSSAEFYLVWGAAAVLSLAASLPFLLAHYRALAPEREDGTRATFAGVARRLVGLGSLAQASNVVQFLNYRSLFFALERHAGLAAVGLFSTAVSLAEVLWIPANSIAALTLNRVSRAASEPATRTFVLRMARLALVAMLVAAAVAAVVPVEGLTGLLGRDFGGVRALLLQLLPGVVALGLSLVASSYNAGHALYWRNLQAALAGLALTAAGYFVLIPRMGAGGAVLAMNLAYLAITLWLLAGFVTRERVSLLEFVPRLSDLNALREGRP